jgi:hypothetical protein
MALFPTNPMNDQLSPEQIARIEEQPRIEHPPLMRERAWTLVTKILGIHGRQPPVSVAGEIPEDVAVAEQEMQAMLDSDALYSTAVTLKDEVEALERQLNELALAHSLEKEELEARLAEAERRRDLAIAHDTQPYPTAHAYERVCAALNKSREEKDAQSATISQMDSDNADLREKYNKLVVDHAEAVAGETEMQELESLRDQVLALQAHVERLREAMDAKIIGQSAEPYLYIQFPATMGHIPLQDWFANLRKASASSPDLGLIERVIKVLKFARDEIDYAGNKQICDLLTELGSKP